MTRLRLTEIFYSIQGESCSVGCPTVFIRLTGCPLRCHYCDTTYAFHQGEWKNLDDILTDVAQYNAHYVTVTGGEPLAQKSCLVLLKALCDLGYKVSLETSGALSVAAVDTRVVKIIDIKTPASGEVDKNLFENLEYIQPHDQIKFVVCNQADYEWAKQILKKYRLTDGCEVLFSPSYMTQNAGELADWILKDQLPVRLQIQLHKYLWGDVPGR